jgi:diacylglycerol kinase family enzyme
VVETTRHGEGMKAAADAARNGRFDAILAAGGDGTVHDAAEGLIGSSTPLGIIPMGTANVLAREINLPRTPVQLAEALLEGAIRNIAVGQVNGRPFLFVVGVGFDAEAVRLFERESTRKWGQAGYLWPIARALLFYKGRSIRAVTPRGVTAGQWILILRTKRYAGDFMVAPGANLEVAAFHVVRIQGGGLWTRIRQLSALALGRLSQDPEVSIEVTDRAIVEGDRTIPVEIDGEALGELPLQIGIHPERLAVIFPFRS